MSNYIIIGQSGDRRRKRRRRKKEEEETWEKFKNNYQSFFTSMHIPLSICPFTTKEERNKFQNIQTEEGSQNARPSPLNPEGLNKRLPEIIEGRLRPRAKLIFLLGCVSGFLEVNKKSIETGSLLCWLKALHQRDRRLRKYWCKDFNIILL